MKYITPLNESGKPNKFRDTKVTKKNIEDICKDLDIEVIDIKMHSDGFGLSCNNPFRDNAKNIQNIKIFVQTLEDFEKNLLKIDNELRFYYKIGNEISVLSRTGDMVVGG